MPIYQCLCQYAFGRKISRYMAGTLQTVRDGYTVVTGWQEFEMAICGWARYTNVKDVRMNF